VRHEPAELTGFLPELDGLDLAQLRALLVSEPTHPGLSPATFYEEVALQLLEHGEPGREIVVAHLADPVAARRAGALGALAAMPSDELIAPALDALRSTDPVLALTAIDVLRHLGYRDEEGAIAARADDASALVRAAVLRYRASAGDLETLTAALADPDPIVRRSAADLLAETGAVQSAGQLRPLLDDPDGSVRDAAADALASLRDQEDFT
jgi:HEAT repeat protein